MAQTTGTEPATTTLTEIGVLFNTDRKSWPELTDYARRLEGAGIGSVWLAELFGREPFAAAGGLLAVTERLRVGTAIANIYARDAVAAAAASATLAEASGNRFELGLGVSNPGLNQQRGHEWTAPAPRLAAYLRDLRAAKIAVPDHHYPVHVAAHGPRMLAAAADGADGVFTYLMTPEHTARTRRSLADVGSPDATISPMISPMMMCLLCEEPTKARDLVGRAIGYYASLDYYHRAWRTLGFDDADFADGGSDRLRDAVVAWGSIDDIRDRIDAHREAGADRVVVIPLNPAGGRDPDWRLLEGLAG